MERFRKFLMEQFGLSYQQARIIDLFCMGLERKDVCAQINLRPKTVRTYIDKAKKQLGIKTKKELIETLKQYRGSQLFTFSSENGVK